MTTQEIQDITRQRLQAWTQMAFEHHATPILMITAGHDHKSGEIIIHVPNEEQMSVETIQRLLIFAGDQLTVLSGRKN